MESNDTCPIWSTPAKFLEKEAGADYENLDSPRAGGTYWISRSAIKILEYKSILEKILLTDWLVEQRNLGVECPKIYSEILKDIGRRQNSDIFARADNLLHFIEQQSPLIGHVVSFNIAPDKSSLVSNLLLLAWTGSQKVSEVLTLAEYLQEQNWIDLSTGLHSYSSLPYELMLKPEGIKHLSNLRGANTDSANCFVAMWFNEEVQSAYIDAIKPALIESGYKPIRVDEIEHSDKIDDRIIAEIKRARFIIADFTAEPTKPRGGVYYEAGFAQGLGIPVIWTCRTDRIDDVHFDTRQFNHITWNTPEELKEKLIIRVAAVVGDGPFK